MKLIVLLLLVLLVSFSAYSQTNLTFGDKLRQFAGPMQTNMWYNQGENTIELTPNMSSTGLFNKSSNRNYGFSMEYEHWQSLCTGTGFEAGSYDIRNKPYGITHLAILEDYRLVYLPQTFLMGRFSVVAKGGVETYLNDGSKDIEIGIGLNYNITKRTRSEMDVMEHLGSNSTTGNTTVRVGLQYIF